MRWQVTIFVLCTYGFLKEFRPTEPYLYQYEHETLNISTQVLNEQVYPIWTYSYMIALIPVFLLTDLVQYKPMIVLESLCYIVVWSLLVFCGTVFAQQMVELFYGWATAAEIAYFAYIYVKVSKEHFRRVTSLTRGALLLGTFISYAVAQLIILLEWGTYETLNIISLASLCISFFFTLMLPTVPWKCAYERKRLSKDAATLSTNDVTYKNYVAFHCKTLINDMKIIYGNSFMLKWSLWWALASCGYFQVGNYIQTLWGTLIAPNASEVYNGLTEALCPLISLPSVLLVQRLRVDWSQWGELCLTLCSLLNGLLLLVLSQTNSLFVMYAGYIGYRLIFETMITITQANLAEGLESATYGLVFGINTFIALVIQSLLTLVVVSSFGFALVIRQQYVVYSGYHFVVASLFAVPLLLRACLFLTNSLRHKTDKDT
ncbi:Reduced folate carrier [Trichostrongylus colubriformis]|uniref:Reduced folate carrier n=1 Tax=Trichostrongylus colubriformis TaxID=6319 RepID=A0AAN8FYP9_TRICO